MNEKMSIEKVADPCSTRSMTSLWRPYDIMMTSGCNRGQALEDAPPKPSASVTMATSWAKNQQWTSISNHRLLNAHWWRFVK